MMRHVHHLGIAACAAALLLSQTSRASAETTRNYYDATGRLIGAASDRTQVIAHYYDGADNRIGFNARPTIPPPSNRHTLQSGGMLLQDQSLTSDDGRFLLYLQPDGNVILWDTTNWTVVWQTNTSRTQGSIFLLEPNGDLVLYDPQFRRLWATNTQGHPGATLSVQSDSNLVVYDGYTPIWSR